MARKPRFDIPGIPQHVIQRGNNRDACFFDSQDCRYYLAALKAVSEKTGCAIHAYVLMTNHVHLLVTPGERGSLPAMMQGLGRRYVRYLNDRYLRTGTLWEGRYKACLVQSEHYLLTCYRYIELNPVRAGMVSMPGDYQWSSYRCNALGTPDALVSGHEVYTALGESSGTRCKAYRALFESYPAPEELAGIRSSINEELVLGSEQFRDTIANRVRRRVRRGRAGRPAIARN